MRLPPATRPAQGPAIGAAGDCHRQAGQLSGRSRELLPSVTHRAEALSRRDVEELMLARGVVVSYETIRSWCAKFGPDYAAQLGRRRPRPGDKWHFDEVFVTINGTTH